MCTNALFWPSLTPPANPVKFFWSKMACTCVPHIVLHVSCRTRTSGGYFRPSEVRFRAKIPLSSHWFYNVKTQKTHFLKIPEWADFDLLESNCRHIFLHKNQKIYHSEFFFSWYIFWSHVFCSSYVGSASRPPSSNCLSTGYSGTKVLSCLHIMNQRMEHKFVYLRIQSPLFFLED